MTFSDLTADQIATLSVEKQSLSRAKRGYRLLISCVDPRAWFHIFRIVNYYNYTHVTPRRALTLGSGAAISPTASFSNAERITIGTNAHIGGGCTLWAGRAGGVITTGDNLLLGPNVTITTTTYRFNDGAPVKDQRMNEKPVRIGNDVWIGANAIILPGADIGDGAIIAAGAVIRGKVKNMSIMAGVPAKKVGKRDPI